MHMLLYKTIIYISLLTFGYTQNSVWEESDRQSRQIVGEFDEDSLFRENDYKFCLFQNKTLPCLRNDVCAANKGQFVSYCGTDEDYVCCYVAKTCDSHVSSSHGLMFHNPNYPAVEKGGQFCQMNLKIQSGICALRIDFDVFELAVFEKDFCPSDSFLILGTDSVVAPMCGNLTGYSTTFEVKESTLQMAFSLQGTVPNRFFLDIIMLPCADIVPFASPLQAGKRNKDAKTYIPAALLAAIEKAIFTKANAATTEISKTNVTEPNEVNTTEPIDVTATESNDVPVTEPTDAESTKRPVKIEKNYEIQIKAATSGIENDISIVTDAMNVFPRVSIFQKIFDEKTGQQSCGIYDEPVNTIEIARSEPLIPVDDFSDVDCWSYDSETKQLQYSEDCRPAVDIAADEPSFRIIKGSFAKLNEYPWQAALIYNKTFVCGAALITNRHVITAAHCVHGGFKKGMEHLVISLGDHDLSTKNDTNNTVRHIKRVMVNLHYFPLAVTNDIAIIELDEPVKYSYGIRPIRIPMDTSDTYENQTVTIAGWGRFSIKSRRTSPILKKFTSTVSNIDDCVKSWEILKRIGAIKDMHICLNISKGTPCHGDSGGPLISCNNDHCSIVGLVSFAFPLCKDVGLPVVLTRITSFKRWIDINTTPVFYTQRFLDDLT